MPLPLVVRAFRPPPPPLNGLTTKERHFLRLPLSTSVIYTKFNVLLPGLLGSVVDPDPDPDPVGSISFGRIRIRVAPKTNQNHSIKTSKLSVNT